MTRGLTTTQRGYGWVHQQARTKALAELRDGQSCARCGQPMWRAEAALLDLDHDDDRTTYRGLAHRGCNRSAGQATAQQHMRARRQRNPDNVVVNSRRW
ncbi:endonuclease domain-containing protein [Salinispora pacifica]|uniref:endonuclease domain-containing protein n=1 Tax=Salinispora pacifica TaxID=351187 RepID=UPI0004BB7C40|nr:endonuclease domain-containing protein [Salinispora pacifica]